MPSNSSYMRLLPIALILFPLAASAQAPGITDSSGTPRSLAPVEVRAIRAGTDAPFAKTDISGDALQRNNLGQDLPVLLQYTPSAVTTTDAGAGVGYTGLRIRGTDGTRINVTLNGVPVNDAESQSTYFVDLPDLASSTSSIQIQRGVGASTNGAGAFGGTVSIASLRVAEQAGAEAAISYGSFNTQKYTLQAGTGYLGNRFALGIRLSQISSDGFIDRSAAKLQSLQLNAAWKVAPHTTIQGMMLQGEEVTHQAWNGVPEEKLRGPDSALGAHYSANVGSLYFSPQDSANLFSASNRRYNVFLYDNQIDRYRQNYYQLFADQRFSRVLTAHLGIFLTRGIGYYEEYKPNAKYAAYGLSSPVHGNDTFSSTNLIRQLWLDNYNYGAVFSLLTNINPKLKINAGGGASQYIGNHYGYVIWAAEGGVPEHYRWYKLDAQKNDFNAYAKAEYRPSNRWLLYADMQGRAIGYFMNGFRNNPALRPAVSYAFFNPKAGATYFLSGASGLRQKAYASMAIASHEPNRDDFEASPGSLPKPERLYDAEGGYELAARSVSFAANLYYMHYEDQLVLTGKVNDVGAYTRTNVPTSYRAGVELQGTWKLRAWLVFAGNATFSQNRIQGFTEYVDNYDNGTQESIVHGTTDIAFSPATVSSASLTWMPFHRMQRAEGLGVELLGKWVGRQFLDNTGNTSRSLSPYGLCDFRLRYNLPAVGPFFRELGLTLLLNNVLNTAYESNGYTYSYVYGAAVTTQNFYFPQAGFNWLIGVRAKW